MTAAVECPRFIYLHPKVKDGILQQVPEIANITSNRIDRNTVIIVDPEANGAMVNLDDGRFRGVMTVSVDGFFHVLNSIRSFVDRYKSGTPVNDSILKMVEEISKGHTK
jgi:hypothetical protein